MACELFRLRKAMPDLPTVGAQSFSLTNDAVVGQVVPGFRTLGVSGGPFDPGFPTKENIEARPTLQPLVLADALGYWLTGVVDS